MIDLVPLVNKTVEFAYRGARLSFDLSHALFSSYSVDAGTKLLLKEIAHDPGIIEAKNILDSGCGTGIIGISLAASLPDSRIVMRDRDLLACAFAERNCWRNGISALRLRLDGIPAPPIEKRPPKHHRNQSRNAEIVIGPGLLGLEDPLAPYDAIVSNIPAKAGEAVFKAFFETCSGPLLAPGGRLAFVIVNTLAESTKTWLEASGLSIDSTIRGSGHTVYLCRKPPSPGKPHGGFATLERYVRTSGSRKLGRYNFAMAGYQGLPEFDTSSFSTRLAMEAMERCFPGLLARRILVHEPGIGLDACGARALTGASHIAISSRDYLSLEAARANLSKNFSSQAGFSSSSHSSLEPPADVVASVDAAIWHPDDIPGYDPVSMTWDYLGSLVKSGGRVVIVSQAGIVSRYEKLIPKTFRKLGNLHRNGCAALMVERSSTI